MAKRKRKPIVNFATYTILKFIDLVRLVIQHMTGNAHFTTPSPSLASLTGKADDLAKAELKTHGGTPADTQDMYDKRADLEHDMEMLGLYIYITADGDEAKMLTSMYPLTVEEATPTKYPLFYLKQGSSPCEIVAGCKAVKGAKSYLWMYFVGELAPEKIEEYTFFDGSTQAKIIIDGLTSKTKVWVIAKPVLKDRSGNWFVPIWVMVP